MAPFRRDPSTGFEPCSPRVPISRKLALPHAACLRCRQYCYAPFHPREQHAEGIRFDRCTGEGSLLTVSGFFTPPNSSITLYNRQPSLSILRGLFQSLWPGLCSGTTAKSKSSLKCESSGLTSGPRSINPNLNRETQLDSPGSV